jgi:hypothetical protein
MPETWTTIPATEVMPGDRVRLASGVEVIATRVDREFLGRSDLIAFVEDTPDRWLKQPVPVGAEVEVLRAS